MGGPGSGRRPKGGRAGKNYHSTSRNYETYRNARKFPSSNLPLKNRTQRRAFVKNVLNKWRPARRNYRKGGIL